MQWKSTTDRYGAVAIAIHWIAALLIVALLATGFRMADITDPATKVSLVRFHAVAGITVLLLTLARIAWWWFADDKPASVKGVPWLQDRLARTVHVLFYVIILGMAASGIGMMILSGAGQIVFGGASGPLPDFWNYTPRIPHGIAARVLLALFVLHLGAALYHHFVRRDRLLGRMGLGRP
jgi:cytochrome b561